MHYNEEATLVFVSNPSCGPNPHLFPITHCAGYSQQTGVRLWLPCSSYQPGGTYLQTTPVGIWHIVFVTETNSC